MVLSWALSLVVMLTDFVLTSMCYVLTGTVYNDLRLNPLMF